MATLSNPTIDAIYDSYEKRKRSKRRYLGGSQIGEECRRKLWYDFRWVLPVTFPGRILRLFETGSREEDRIIANLRDVGVTIDGEQFEVVCCDGHMKGHFDGVATGLLEAPKTPHLFECKTMNKRQFEELLKKGVEQAKPVHYAQMQLYGYLGELTRWVYIVQCKDDDRLYIERGNIKKTDAKALIRKGQAIINAEEPPERIGKDASFYKCKFCSFAFYCHGTEVFPDVNCRTCVHGEPGPDGSWNCGRGLRTNGGCGEHLYIPGLLHWTTPIDGDETWIEYDAGFINCAETGFPAKDVPTFSSEELRAS